MEPTYVEFREQQYEVFKKFSLTITEDKELAATITDDAFDLLKEQWEQLPSNERCTFLTTTIYDAWQEQYEKVRNHYVNRLLITFHL